MIGQSDVSGFDKHDNKALCYVLFIFTVIISQITFLNMLIAIMAETFETVIELRPALSRMNKPRIMAEMEFIIHSKANNDDKSKVFLYFIEPAKDDDHEGADR